ncbi:MAG: PRC-barrel domain containing protein [Phycisphaerae bacterium]|nr:PRC-barrel domain containing protein [Phycisphaerae bacterium]
MFRNATQLEGYTLEAQDGQIGSVKDFYFDDSRWIVRYLVADTGRWLPGKLVLIAPASLGRPGDGDRFPVSLTKRQVEDSPDIAEDMPVSRQREYEMTQYYGWPIYWTGAGLGGPGTVAVAPLIVPSQPPDQEHSLTEERKGDPHLRSVNEVTGYIIQARDDTVGHVEDFILDDEAWAIRYLVIDTRNWWPGKHVLLAPQWVSLVSWSLSAVQVELTREKIKSAPPYDPSTPITREYEQRLHDHYGREGYWT